MLTANCCPRCGVVREADLGLCPACLMRMALGQVLDTGPSVADSHGSFGRYASQADDLLPDTVEDHITGDQAATATRNGNGSVSPRSLDVLNQYELREILGRGGMGTVYKAWDTRLKRHVAIKMITAGENSHPEELRRFRREAEAVARLHHPTIVQIYEIGEVRGLPFLALEYVPGTSLAKKLTGSAWVTTDAVDLVATLADGVHVAHQSGVVHRDLKPGNILIADDVPDTDSEHSQPRATVRITDFGLAKLTEAEKSESGIFLGTPSYCSPEQAGGRAREMGPATDIFSLGVILYELLTGSAPFRGETLVETLNQVMHREPLSPRAVNPAVPRDVQTICLKAMAKSPGNRYLSAREFAEDLRRWRAGLPILARRVGALERGWRWCRRNPVVAGLLTLTAVALIAGTAVSTTLAVIANRRAATIDSINENLTKANAAKTKAAEAAKEQARIADEQSQLALKTLESVIFDIQNKLADVPNAQDVRGDLLQTALDGLENLSAKLRSDTRVDRGTAMATLNLAEVFRQVNKKSGLAKNESSLQLYERATAAFEKLYEAATDDLTATRDLAEACLLYACDLGRSDDSGLTVTAETIANQKGRPRLTQALVLHKRAIALRRKLLADDPGDGSARYELARALTEWAYQEVRSGKAEDARDALVESADLLRALIKSHPKNVAYRSMLGTTTSRLGDYYLDMVKDGHELAAPHYEESLRTLEKLTAEQPSDHDVAMECAEAWSRMGDLWAARKQYEKALAAFQKELEMTQSLEKLAPNNAELMWDSSISYDHVARELLRLKRYPEAEPVLRRVSEIRGPLVDINPGDRRSQSLLLMTQRRLGLTYEKLDQPDRAIAAYELGLERITAYRDRTGDRSFDARIADLETALKQARAK